MCGEFGSSGRIHHVGSNIKLTASLLLSALPLLCSHRQHSPPPSRRRPLRHLPGTMDNGSAESMGSLPLGTKQRPSSARNGMPDSAPVRRPKRKLRRRTSSTWSSPRLLRRLPPRLHRGSWPRPWPHPTLFGLRNGRAFWMPSCKSRTPPRKRCIYRTL